MGLSTTVADARFAKPLDQDLIRQLARHHPALITVEDGSTGGAAFVLQFLVEDGSTGGFAAFVLQFLAEDGALDAGLRVRPMMLPDRFQDHDTPERQYAEAGLDAASITSVALALAGRSALASGHEAGRGAQAIGPCVEPL